MDQVASLLPTTIEGATKATPVAMLLKVVDQQNIEAFLAIELTKLASLVNVDERLNLQGHQIPFIARQLVETFPNESLADFKLCFERGAISRYDDKLLRLDAAVIFKWMERYLDEKYQVIESQLMAEKDDLYRPAPQTFSEEAQDQKVKDRLKAWLETVQGESKKNKVSPITDDEIRMEGQQKPAKREPYINGLTLEEVTMQDKIRREASDFYKDLLSFSDLKLFMVGKYQIFAKTESDALTIYQQARNPH